MSATKKTNQSMRSRVVRLFQRGWQIKIFSTFELRRSQLHENLQKLISERGNRKPALSHY